MSLNNNAKKKKNHLDLLLDIFIYNVLKREIIRMKSVKMSIVRL